MDQVLANAMVGLSLLGNAANATSWSLMVALGFRSEHVGLVIIYSGFLVFIY